MVRLRGGGVEAAEKVYEIAPHHWASFFEDLSKNWRGWQGEKSHESLEHQLQIVATADHLGHIRLRITLRGDMSGSDWLAIDSISLEAGQLGQIATSAREYFG